ncbi:hypothetical protein SDC9_157591 [bioreactor metagenome]|uniref:Uncharacterized protein n=1 Tax=bioreactor metagenome TaxID=1076179 RepID=A0A645F9J6_9ZZZZ
MVEGHIEKYHGYVERRGDVFIPFDNRIADVVAAEYQVGTGDVARRAGEHVHIRQVHARV